MTVWGTRTGQWASIGPLAALALGCGAASGNPGAPSAPERVAALCAGVPAPEIERPSVLQATEIEGVRALMGERRYLKYAVPELRGADIVVRSTPSRTRQWVTRVVLCHVAWLEAPAYGFRESDADPLAVGAPDVSFADTESGFVIRIAGHDHAEGEEILRRARRLTEPPVGTAHP